MSRTSHASLQAPFSRSAASSTALDRPSGPGRRRHFDASVTSNGQDISHESSRTVTAAGERRRARARTAVNATAGVVSSVVGGPLGIIANAVSGATSQGAASGAVGDRAEQMEQFWDMQSESQSFNMEFLSMQQSVQNDNRHFTTLTNLLKARHDTARAAISNIRV